MGLITEAPVLVVGLGNPFRGDDAAGLLAARMIAGSRRDGLRAILCDGDPLSLLDHWQPASHFVLIDAMHSGGTPGEIRQLTLDQALQPARTKFRFSSHDYGLREVLRLGQCLHRLPAHVTVYGIEGRRFEIGAPPQPAVRKAATLLAERLVHEFGNASRDGTPEGADKPAHFGSDHRCG